MDNVSRDIVIILESLFAQAGNGLVFSNNSYDQRRYEGILAELGKLALLLSETSTQLNLISYLHQSSNHLTVLKEYITPKVAVAIVVFNAHGEVLLVQRFDGIWALPGGYAEVGQDPIENAKREVREETGLDVKILSLIGVYDSNISLFPSHGRQVYTLGFCAAVAGGTVTPDMVETKDVSFFNLNSLPILPPASEIQIKHARRVLHSEPVAAFVDHHDEK